MHSPLPACVFPACVVALCLLMAVPTHAQQGAVRADHALHDVQKNLKQVQDDLDTARNKVHAYDNVVEKAEGDLAKISKHITTITTTIRKQDKALQAMATQLKALEKKRREIRQRIDERKHMMARLSMVIVRLSSTPEEAAIMLMPGSLVDKARNARSLSLVSASLHEQTALLAAQVREVDTLSLDITKKRHTMEAKLSVLEGERVELQAVLTQRKQVLESLYSEQIQQQKHVANIARKADSLQQLVQNLEHARTKQEEARYQNIGKPIAKPIAKPIIASTVQQTVSNNTQQVAFTMQPRAKRVSAPPPPQVDYASNAMPFSGMRGKLPLPVNGRITAGYGTRKSAQETLRGVEIAARAGTQISAPHAGEVQFAGQFSGYGNMVILRHKGGYHTLIAHMQQVYVLPGQTVGSGEPLGLASGSKVTYMELRHQGRPVDPRSWIRNYRAHLARK